MTTTPTDLFPPILPPAGAAVLEDWQGDAHPYRFIESTRTVTAEQRGTNHEVKVFTTAVQWADGTIDTGRVEAPYIAVYRLDEKTLNADQARELASALLEAAEEIDRWSGTQPDTADLLANARQVLEEAYSAACTLPGNAGDYARAALDSIGDAIKAVQR